MTTTVTMNTAVYGPSGLMAAGSTQTLADDFAADLIHSKRATRVTPQDTGGGQVFGSQLTGGGVAIDMGSGDSVVVGSANFTVRAALGIAGQSGEMGSTLQADANGTLQRVALSAPAQGIFEPTQMAPAGGGSMFVRVAEKLAADGVKVDLHIGAVGGTSFYLDWTGMVYMGGRGNSTAYRGKRSSLGTGDPGHRGDMIFVNGATWEATTGNRHLVFWRDPGNPITLGGGTWFADPGYIVKETNLVTASTPPTFPGSPVVGNTVVDGGITWTCVHVGAKVTETPQVHVLRITEDGFDPYGLCKRLRDALMGSVVSPSKRFVYFQNGQSDAGVATAIYTIALRVLGQYFGQAPYLIQPIFGLSIFNPSQTTANWDLLETTLSNGGLAATPNYATSALTTGMVALGYHLAQPGEAITNFGFYYGRSLYRAFGANVADLLEVGGPHPTLAGVEMCARALAPTISRILRNSAT